MSKEESVLYLLNPKSWCPITTNQRHDVF